MRRVNPQRFTTGVVLFLLCIFSQAFAQNKTVTGTITDPTGKGVPGVTVTVKGTKTATQTDASGTYRISAPDDATLVFSSVGFETREMAVAGRTSFDASLTATNANLSEVVVIGYGTARRKDLTGSVSTVTERNFNKGTYTSPDQLVQGKVAGVQIVNNSGQPGGATTVKIRGSSSVSGSGQPLYVVDGVALDGRSVRPSIGDLGFGGGNPASNPLNFLNPADIASIDILKDASATAIYGSRAAYGVVLITTKKGQSGETRIDFNASYGLSSIMKRIRVLNASEFRDALSYYGVSKSNDKGGDVNALDAILRTGKVQNYNVAISGGNENGRYRLSLGALNQEGIIRKSGIKKYTASFTDNFKFLPSRRLGLDISVTPSQYTEDIVPITNDAGATGSLIGQALQWNPTLPVKIGDSLVNVGGNSIFNPLGVSEAFNDQAVVTTILASLSPYVKLTNSLEYRFLYSINYSTGSRRTSVKQNINIDNYNGVGYAAISQNVLTTQQFTHTLNFNKQLSNDLSLSAVVGYEYLKYTNKGVSENARGLRSVGGFGFYGLDYTNYIQFSDPATRNVTSFVDPNAEIQSYFIRANFNYRDKYLLTGTFRADGSTKFGSNNKYGYFPSVAGAWNILKESFFDVPAFSVLKLRAGWGKTGNQEFPAGSSQRRYSFTASGGNQLINNPNPDLKWQSDRQYNIGLDVSVLKGRVSATIDYFNKLTTDLLFPTIPIAPAAAGVAVTWKNIAGNIENKGFEFSVNAGIIQKKDFSLDFNANATFIKNNVSGLAAPIPTGALNGQGVSGSTIQVLTNGFPINAFFLKTFLNLDKASGLSVYVDDNVPFYSGSPNPKVVLGFGASVQYKKFSLIANMNGALGQKLYNNTFNNVINVGDINGGRNIAYSVYKDPVKESFSNRVTSSTRFLESGSYLKMSNATLSYRVGNLFSVLRGASVYVIGQNLFVITKFKGFDPEVNVDKNVNGVPSNGIEYTPYPSARTVTFGINFSL